MRFKPFALKLSVLLAAAIFIPLCFEAFFRLTRGKDALNLSIGRRHAKYLTSLAPNSTLRLVSNEPGEYDTTARINNYGFRGPDIAIEKLPGQRRIFLIGDSFTFGVGAKDDETISYFLQQQLDPTMKKIEVVNLGHGHNSPIIHYLRLRDELPKFRPDLVVMLLDFSDLADDWNFEKHAPTAPMSGPINGQKDACSGVLRKENFIRIYFRLSSSKHSRLNMESHSSICSMRSGRMRTKCFIFPTTAISRRPPTKSPLRRSPQPLPPSSLTKPLFSLPV